MGVELRLPALSWDPHGPPKLLKSMPRGYPRHPNIITKAKSKAIQPWHFRMPHTLTTHRPETVQVRTTTNLKQLSYAPTNNDDLIVAWSS